MDKTVPPARLARDILPVALLGGLPMALVLWDLLTRADPYSNLWWMPLPALATLAALVFFAGATGAFAAADLRQRLLAPGSPARWLTLSLAALAVLAVGLSALRASHFDYSLIKLGELALVATATLALVAVLLRSGPDLSRLLLLALATGIALAAVLAIVLHRLGLPQGYPVLFLPGFTHIRILGFSLAMALMASVALWPLAPDRPQRILVAVVMTLLWTALFWSGGRGALLAILASLLVLAALLPPLRRTLLPLAATAIMGLACAWLIGGSGTGDFGLAGRVAGALDSDSADALSSGRLEMWRTLWAALLDAPLLGHGYAQTRWLFLDAGVTTPHLHAHNIALDAALGLGLPGALALAALVLVAWCLSVAAARRDPIPARIGGTTMLTVFLLHALVDGIYFYPQGLVPLAVAIALLIAAPGPRRT